jgi:hypothetical protein
MKRHAANLPDASVEFERKAVIFGKMNSRKGDPLDPVPDPVVIPDFEIGLGENPVPLDAVEQVLNRLHPVTPSARAVPEWIRGKGLSLIPAT